MRGPVQKTCGRCGQAFQCDGYQCWCGTIGVTEEQMDWIAARYEDCLCPACLGQITIGELGIHPDPTGNRRAD